LFREREWRYLLAVLALSDLLCLVAAFAIAGWLLSQPALGSRHFDQYVGLVLAVLPILAVIFLVQGLYDPQSLLGGAREFAAAFRACTYGLVALILLGFALHSRISREWILLSWALAIALVGVLRFAIRRAAYLLRRRGRFIIRVVVVGVDAHSVAVASQLSRPSSGVEVVGFLDDYVAAGTVIVRSLRVLGAPADLIRVAARMNLHEVIVVPQALPWETLQSLLLETTVASSGLRLHLSAGIYDLLTTGVRLSERNHVPLLTLNKARLSPFESALKTTLDYGLATSLLIVFAPAFLLIAAWLRARGIRPVFQRRLVAGRYGRRFQQLSFAASPPLGGDLLRKLPGLLNVLMGQLSIVGPRPLDGIEPSGMLGQGSTLTIRPGLTGPWRQVEDPGDQVLLDLYYIRSYSIWLDLQVLFRRLRSRLRRRRPAAHPRAGQPAPTGRA
jgi:lipopolysaccharide/colanic/teichoic acid biosynthesis glycosyltransferase